MHTNNLRKVGGLVMLVVPKPRPRYTMAELMAASDYSQPQPQPAEERERIDVPAVGGELGDKGVRFADPAHCLHTMYI